MQRFEGNLTVQVEQSVVVDVTLSVGQTAAEVSVQDVTPLVTVDNATLGGTLEHTRIEQLPLNGRAVMSLLQTVPGMEGTRAFGIRDGSEDVVVDGATIMDRSGWNTVNPRQPGLDSIQEFTVVDNGTSAKYARPTTVVMSTKNGTNQLHGSAFETNRNNAIGLARSRTDYYTKAPFLNRNEFGVSAGGPVFIPKLYNGKNKTFWFFSYEGLRLIQNTTQGFPTPTDAMRNGDMSGIVDANGLRSTIYDPYSTDSVTWARTPFPNNRIPRESGEPARQVPAGCDTTAHPRQREPKRGRQLVRRRAFFPAQLDYQRPGRPEGGTERYFLFPVLAGELLHTIPVLQSADPRLEQGAIRNAGVQGAQQERRRFVVAHLLADPLQRTAGQRLVRPLVCRHRRPDAQLRRRAWAARIRSESAAGLVYTAPVSKR